jgi:hypothetical protein
LKDGEEESEQTGFAVCVAELVENETRYHVNGYREGLAESVQRGYII